MLAAGAGTRLRPLTSHRPKALCPVNNRPLVDYAIDRLAAHAEAVAVNVHHGREQLEAHLGGRVHLSVEEPRALGTAGALGALREWIAGRPTLLTNADAWLRDDLVALVEGWDGERVRLLVIEDSEAGDFGPYRYVGAAVLPWSTVRPLQPEPAGLYEASWRHHEAAGSIDLAVTAATCIDCGTPCGYLAANLDASGGHSVIGPGADVQGEVIRSVVWPGARVAPGERLVEAIRVGADVTVDAALA